MRPQLSSWDEIERYTGWKPKPLRRRDAYLKLKAIGRQIEIIKNEPGKPLTNEQRRQLFHRGYR